MLGEVFYWLFNMSIAATVTGFCVLLLRKVKSLPRRVIFFLWVIPFLRMCLPIGVGSKYGLMALLSEITSKTIVVYEYADDSAVTMMNFAMGADSYFPITYKENIVGHIFEIASIIWLVVAIILLIVLALLYISTKRELRSDTHFSEKIESPAVYGIVRPRILFPASYKDKDLTFPLLHENVHKKRGDNLWRLIAFVVTAIHWFNPFVWMFLRAFLEDLELSCDEIVLSKCGEEQKKAYAAALVDCMENRTIFASAFGGAKIQVRLQNILSYKKLSVFSAICFAVLIIVTAYVLLTNAPI